MDHLTGLPGREVLEELSARFACSGEPWSVAMVDVDDFKLINDTYGHLLGDAVLAEVASLLRKQARSGDVVFRYGGDEFSVVFPHTPQEGALRCAQRLTQAVERLVVPHGIRLSLSVGLAHGSPAEVTLQTLLAWADEALYAAKRRGKGCVVVYEPGRTRERLEEFSFPAMVGRTQEVRLLRQLADEALVKGARVALVLGDVGVGKTRLAQELARYGSFRGFQVEWHPCAQLVQDPPCRVLVSPLRNVLSRMEPHEVEQVVRGVGPVHPATGALIPQMAVQAGGEFLSEEALKFRVWDDLVAVLRVITALRPLMLIVDDAHWLSAYDLQFLAYVLRAAPDAVVMLVATASADPAHEAKVEPLRALTGTVRSEVIRLGNLGADEVASLVSLALRDPHVPFEVLGHLSRQSGGNPFFLRELLLSYHQAGCIGRTEGGWVYRLETLPSLTPSLVQVISRRLGSLSPQAQQVLKAAALAGGPFSVALVAHALQLPEAHVAACLEEARAVGILAEVSEPEPGYVFVHDTVREFAAQEVAGPMKTLLHTRMGTFCEELWRQGRDDMLIPTASHFSLGADPQKACRYALHVARLTASHHASREALRWVEVYLKRRAATEDDREDLLWALTTKASALGVVGQAEEAQRVLREALPLAMTSEERARVLFLMGENAQKLARYDEARARYAEALAHVDAPVERAEIQLALVYLDIIQGRLRDAWEGLGQVKALLEGAGESPRIPHAWAGYHKRMGDVLQDRGETQEALSHYQRAQEMYRRLQDKQGESAVANNMASCYDTLGDPEQALQLLFEALRLNTELDDALGMAIACFNIADMYASLNQVPLCMEYLSRYEALSKRIGNELAEGYGHLVRGNLAVLERDLITAEAQYRLSAQAFRTLGVEGLEAAAKVRLAEVLVDLGREEASSVVEDLAALTSSRTPELAGEVSSLQARMALMQGAHDRAVDLCTQALARLHPGDVMGFLKAWHLLSLAWEGQGRAQEAVEAIERGVELLRGYVQRISNHSYRSGVLQRPEVRSLCARYKSLTGRFPALPA